MVSGFQFCDSPGILDKSLKMLLYPLRYVRYVHLHRIDETLIEQQFLSQQQFERLILRIPIRSISLLTTTGQQLPGILIHLRPENGGVPYYGYDSIQHHLIFLCRNDKSAQKKGHAQ